ncbi:MAG TPA: TIGR00374 family protein, partial [Bacteroidia bacterium]|nr:TIGR00374 family protein [Bacteroidia bacterium]
MKKLTAKSIIQIVVLLGLGVLLVWLALSQVAEKKDEILLAFQNANYFWVAISIIIGFFSHFLR